MPAYHQADSFVPVYPRFPSHSGVHSMLLSKLHKPRKQNAHQNGLTSRELEVEAAGAYKFAGMKAVDIT